MNEFICSFHFIPFYFSLFIDHAHCAADETDETHTVHRPNLPEAVT